MANQELVARPGFAGRIGLLNVFRNRRDVFWAVVTVFALTVAAAGVGILVSAQGQRQNLDHRLQAEATLIASAVDLKLMTYIAVLETMAQSTVLWDDFDLDSFAEEARRVADEFDGYFLVSAGGEMMEVLFSTMMSVGPTPQAEPRANFPEAVRAEQESLRLGRGVLSDAFFARRMRELVVTIARPIETLRTPKLFLYFTFTLNELTQWLEAVDLAPDEFVGIADGSRRVI